MIHRIVWLSQVLSFKYRKVDPENFKRQLLLTIALHLEAQDNNHYINRKQDLCKKKKVKNHFMLPYKLSIQNICQVGRYTHKEKEQYHASHTVQLHVKVSRRDQEGINDLSRRDKWSIPPALYYCTIGLGSTRPIFCSLYVPFDLSVP